MFLEKLTAINLGPALAVAQEIFPYEMKDGHLSFEGAYLEAVVKNQLNFAYYLAREGNNLLGITGHYPSDQFCKDSIWLGWFGVRPNFRGYGYGTKILKETINIV